MPVDGNRADFVAGRDDEPRRCFASEPIPAVYEQVMGEIRVVPPHVGPDGYFNPPVYRRTAVAREVRPREDRSFEAPCPAEITRDFVAALQRALAARGFYAGAPTGRLDPPTRAAIRRYQADRGLDSAKLSIETARSLGAIAVARED